MPLHVALLHPTPLLRCSARNRQRHDTKRLGRVGAHRQQAPVAPVHSPAGPAAGRRHIALRVAVAVGRVARGQFVREQRGRQLRGFGAGACDGYCGVATGKWRERAETEYGYVAC